MEIFQDPGTGHAHARHEHWSGAGSAVASSLLLCALMTDFWFGMQLYESFMLCLLSFPCSTFVGGNDSSIIIYNILAPILMFFTQ